MKKPDIHVDANGHYNLRSGQRRRRAGCGLTRLPTRLAAGRQRVAQTPVSGAFQVQIEPPATGCCILAQECHS